MLAYSGRTAFDLAPLNLTRLVNEMRELLRASAPGGWRSSTIWRASLPDVVADPAQLRQIVLNLATTPPRRSATRRAPSHCAPDSSTARTPISIRSIWPRHYPTATTSGSRSRTPVRVWTSRLARVCSIRSSPPSSPVAGSDWPPCSASSAVIAGTIHVESQTGQRQHVPRAATGERGDRQRTGGAHVSGRVARSGPRPARRRRNAGA